MSTTLDHFIHNAENSSSIGRYVMNTKDDISIMAYKKPINITEVTHDDLDNMTSEHIFYVSALSVYGLNPFVLELKVLDINDDEMIVEHMRPVTMEPITLRTSRAYLQSRRETYPLYRKCE